MENILWARCLTALISEFGGRGRSISEFKGSLDYIVLEFEASQCYIVRHSLKKKETQSI